MVDQYEMIILFKIDYEISKILKNIKLKNVKKILENVKNKVCEISTPKYEFL